jgi:hypothetical protein
MTDYAGRRHGHRCAAPPDAEGRTVSGTLYEFETVEVSRRVKEIPRIAGLGIKSSLLSFQKTTMIDQNIMQGICFLFL